MEVIDKETIIRNICYTELVYGRINKKLALKLSKAEIELFIRDLLTDTPLKEYSHKGKNYYAANSEYNIRVTINSNTFRVITVDKPN